MDEALQRKIASNESLLREANEAIQRGLWPGDEDKLVRFRCECAEVECNQVVELTMAEYERIRTNPRWFILVAGHQHESVEKVVERAEGYVVVQKEGEGGRVADATDPRGPVRGARG